MIASRTPPLHNLGISPSPGRGRLFYGCATALALGLAVLLALWLIWSQIVLPLAASHAGPKMVPSASTIVTDEDIVDVRSRLSAFIQSIDSQRSGDTLALDSTDLQALIRSFPTFFPLAENLRLAVDGDRVRGEFAFPLDDFGMPGQYLNFSGALVVALEAGKLRVSPETGSFNNQPLPEPLVEQLKNINLARALNEQPALKDRLSSIGSISVRGGAIYISTK